MLNLSDKELDRLSREAAEQFVPDEDISSWEKISARLDFEIGNKPTSSIRHITRGPTGYSAAIILLLAIGYFVWKLEKNSDNTQINTTEQYNSTKPSQASTDKKTSTPSLNEASQQSEKNEVSSKNEPSSARAGTAPNSTPASAPGLTTAQRELAASSPAAATLHPQDRATGGKTLSGPGHEDVSPLTAGGNASFKQPENHPLAGLSGANTQKGLPGKGDPVPGRNAIESNRDGGAGIVVSEQAATHPNQAPGMASQSAKSIPSASGEDLLKSPLPAMAILGDPFYGVNDASLRNYKPQVASNKTSVVNPGKKNSGSMQLNRGLKIGLLFAPDITAVNSVAPEKLSSNFGLTLGYEFANRISINTGILFTKKNYSANGSDFHPTTNNFPAGMHLEYVNGNCNMLEIPLSVRYDFESVGRSSFFVNGGLSSYLMKHEEYTYYMHYYNGGTVYPTQYHKVFNTNENYLFSILSLSAGVETRLSKSLSLQAEPFLKIPLQGVGVGHLELSSYGIAFSLRYAPLLKKSRPVAHPSTYSK